MAASAKVHQDHRTHHRKLTEITTAKLAKLPMRCAQHTDLSPRSKRPKARQKKQQSQKEQQRASDNPTKWSISSITKETNRLKPIHKTPSHANHLLYSREQVSRCQAHQTYLAHKFKAHKLSIWPPSPKSPSSKTIP